MNKKTAINLSRWIFEGIYLTQSSLHVGRYNWELSNIDGNTVGKLWKKRFWDEYRWDCIYALTRNSQGQWLQEES